MARKRKGKSKGGTRSAVIVRPKRVLARAKRESDFRVNVKDVALKSLIGGAGAVALGTVANKLPVPEQVKPFIPALVGIAALNTVKGKVAQAVLPVVVGAMVYSTVAAAKKFIPNLQLAGEKLGIKYNAAKNNLLSGNNYPMAYIPEFENTLTLTY